MKKTIYCLLATSFIYVAVSAQTSSDNPFVNADKANSEAPAENIWGKTSNPYNEADISNMKKRNTGTTNVVSGPIDGGLLVLLGAGALYGSRRLRKNKATSE